MGPFDCLHTVEGAPYDSIIDVSLYSPLHVASLAVARRLCLCYVKNDLSTMASGFRAPFMVTSGLWDCCPSVSPAENTSIKSVTTAAKAIGPDN